jgi:hypothetical protein
MKRGRGRPRKYPNNAQKQAAYRRRKQENERMELIERVLWRTPLRGKSFPEVERELQTLTIRKLKKRLRNIVTTREDF